MCGFWWPDTGRRMVSCTGRLSPAANYTVSPFPGFGMDGDPSRGVHAGVQGRGAGLDQWGAWAVALRVACGDTSFCSGRRAAPVGSRSPFRFAPVTGPAVLLHSDNDKRMLRARPGLRRRSGVKRNTGAEHPKDLVGEAVVELSNRVASGIRLGGPPPFGSPPWEGAHS